MTVRFECTNGIALVTIDNPPVNAISRDVRQGLLDAMEQALANNAERMIITGHGKAFVAGADAKEFGDPPKGPHLNDVLARLSSLPIPTVSAINGVALGGGLEIALATRYRIAAPSATLGLPEVTLGIVPGAGGTQRLPRLVGVTKAIEMVGSGKAISAVEAVAVGLVDEMSGEPTDAARALPMETLRNAVRTDEIEPPISNIIDVDAAIAQVKRRSPGQIAPEKAVALVVDAMTLPIDEGLAKERATFLELRGSEQAEALRHVFFAERAAVSQGNEFPRPASPVKTAIVVGGGNMGASIAYALATGGLRVTVIETNSEASLRAEANVARLIDQGFTRGLLSEQGTVDLRARIEHRIGYDGIKPVDLAIEAAFEDMEVKRSIFDMLAKGLPESTILATNTSYLDVNKFAETIPAPERFLGLHFFSPAHIMKLLEIVKGDKTSDATLGVSFALAKLLQKIPVLSGVCDGFIGNRILSRYRHAADVLLLEGATPTEVDEAMRSFGMAMGPYEAQDMSGLDIGYANRKRQNLRNRSDVRYIPILDRLIEENGRLGRKSGAGWYDYEGSKSITSDVVYGQLVRASDEAGVHRTEVPQKEIQNRLVLAMIAEAVAILEEGIAQRPRDIDLVLIHGYGFPRWRGGLMHYADHLGVEEVNDRLVRLQRSDPSSWPASGLLLKLVSEGRTFASLN
jgi:3-hydroxyacyl-CoA dehydrogenase